MVFEYKSIITSLSVVQCDTYVRIGTGRSVIANIIMYGGTDINIYTILLH